MKRYYVLCFLLLFLAENICAQKRVTSRRGIYDDAIVENKKDRKRKIREDIFGNTIIETRNNKIKIGRDIFGYLQYEDNTMKASLKKDVFDNTVYTDSKGNEIKYSKEYWADINEDFRNNEEGIFMWLIEVCSETRNFKEEYSVDIFGYLQYKNSRNETSSLKKDIFDNTIYSDTKGNEIKYSKEYWADINRDFRNDERDIFMWLIDVCADTKNFKEEYTVDIFDYLQYKNSMNETASLEKDIFDNTIYKDSNGNEIKYSANNWNTILRRQGSEYSIFFNMVHRYLYDE